MGSGSRWFLTTAVAPGFAEEGLGVDPAVSDEWMHIDEIRTTGSAIVRLNPSERVHFRVCTFEAFLGEAFPKGARYDLLVFRDVLHHVPRSKESSKEHELVNNRIEDLRSALSLLNNPGYLYVVEPTRPSKLYAEGHNFYRTLRGAPTVDWDSKRAPFELMLIFESAGLEVTGMTRLSAHHSLIPGGHMLAKIMASQFLLAARMLKT